MGTAERKERELGANAEAADANARAPHMGPSTAFIKTDQEALRLSDQERLGVKL